MSSIYVADLAAYNSGILHGKWVEVTDPETMEKEINSILTYGEEYAIHDYEGIECGESDTMQNVCRKNDLLTKYGDAWTAYVNLVGEYATEEGFQSDFYCECQSVEDFVYDLVQETMEIPEHIAPYFDYDAYQRDLFIGDFSVEEVNGIKYIFS